MEHLRYLRIYVISTVLFAFWMSAHAADPASLRLISRFPITQWNGCYTETGFFHIDYTSNKSETATIANYAWNGKKRWQITLPPARLPYVNGENVAISQNGHRMTILFTEGRHPRLCTWKDGVKGSDISLPLNMGWPEKEGNNGTWVVVQNDGRTVIVSDDFIWDQARPNITIRVIVVEGKHVILSGKYTSPVSILKTGTTSSYGISITPDGSALAIASSSTSTHTSFEYLTLSTDKQQVKLTQRLFTVLACQLSYVYQQYAVTWPYGQIYNGCREVQKGEGWRTLQPSLGENYPVCLQSKINAQVLRVVRFTDFKTWEMPMQKDWENAHVSRDGRFVAMLNPVSGQPMKRKICIYERPGTLRASITMPVKELRKPPIPSWPVTSGIVLTLSPDGHTVVAVEQPGKAKGEVVVYAW